MPTTADRLLRDHQRYTGDGLPNAPTGAPLPVGDPASGVYNPTKKDLRDALNGLTGSADAADEAAARAIAAAETVEAATSSLMPRTFRRGQGVPLSTDGRTLYAVKRAIYLAKNNVSGSMVRITTMGDSWSYLPENPEALAKLTEATVSTTLRSFIPANADAAGTWGGVSTTVSAGWTYQDASTPSIVWAYGAGVDGHVLYTSGNSQTFTASGVTATTVNIYTGAFGGTWRYRVDGGSWTTVSDGTGGGLVSTPVTLNGTKTIEISTVGNTGVVAFYGMRAVSARRTSIFKCGNGGLTGTRLSNYINQPQVVPMLATFNSHLVVLNLGTNDYRIPGATVSAYIQAIDDLRVAVRTAVPVCGIIVVVPPQSDGTVVTPLSQYRDAAYEYCVTHDCEFLNALDAFGGYNSAMWNDSLHLNQSGADMLVGLLNQQFFSMVRL